MAYEPGEMRDDHGRWTASGAVHKILKSLGGLREHQGRKAIGDRHALDTSRIHGDGKGKYNEARAELHKQILAHFLAEGVSRPAGSSPEAIFTAGGPASGKSALAGRAEVRPGEPNRNLPVPRGHVYINPDDIKEHLPEYQMLKDAGRADIAASAVHEESSDIAKVLQRVAMEHNMPIVVDGVGDSEKGKFAGKLKDARDRNYNVTVRYAHLPLEIAQEREKARAERTGRKVEEGYLTKAHRTVSARYNSEIRHMRNVRHEVYSTLGQGKPALIAVRDLRHGRGVRVIDRKAYSDHMSKSGTNRRVTA